MANHTNLKDSELAETAIGKLIRASVRVSVFISGKYCAQVQTGFRGNCAACDDAPRLQPNQDVGLENRAHLSCSVCVRTRRRFQSMTLLSPPLPSLLPSPLPSCARVCVCVDVQKKRIVFQVTLSNHP